MKRALLFSLLSVALALILPFFLLPKPTVQSGAETESAASNGEKAPDAAGDEQLSRTLTDEDLMLRVLTEGEVREMSMAEYLPMALAGEMPASFEPEALKAQAVALRSYALYYRSQPKTAHSDADICTDSGCCAAAYTAEQMEEVWGDDAESYRAKILAAVEATDGQYLTYEDEAILAMFHSSSSTATEAGESLRTALPYLVSVRSPETEEDVRNLVSSVEVSAEEFRASVSRSFPTVSLDGEPESWIGEVTPSAGGRVGSIEVGNQEISGLAMRQLFSLRSTDFSLQWTGESFLFTVSGYGHGLGMSQYGANAMAKDGAFYADILAHYYPGTELVVAVEVLG